LQRPAAHRCKEGEGICQSQRRAKVAAGEVKGETK